MEVQERKDDHVEMIRKAMTLRKMSRVSLVSYSRVGKSTLDSILSYHKAITPLNAIGIARALKCFTAKELLIKQVDWQLERLGKG